VTATDGHRRVAILTSGGDAPGMNAAIRAATVAAIEAGWGVVGVRHGFRGLCAGALAPLTLADVRAIQGRGGTVLGSARCPELADRVVRDHARDVLAAARVEAVIVIGGDGSMRGAAALSDPAERRTGGARVVGVPASIDNDLPMTATIGADTALNTIVAACDRLADTADSHERAFIVEVMGRDCGWLAVGAAEAVGADAVLYPEAGLDDDAVVAAVVAAIQQARARAGARNVLVIKAEGVRITTEQLRRRVDDVLAAAGDRFETRTAILGHLVRGGAPTAFDRVLASRLGRVAMRAALVGADRVMATWSPPSPFTPAAPRADRLCSFIDLLEASGNAALAHAG